MNGGEAKDILLSSLESSGIFIPTGATSAKDLDESSLFAVFAQSLRLLDGSAPPLPASLPDSTAERAKVCADIASAVASAGYRGGDLSFHQFLYPSAEDSYKLVKFLVKRLSESSERRKVYGEGVGSCASSEGGEERSDGVEGSKSSQKVISLEKALAEASDPSFENVSVNSKGSRNSNVVTEIEGEDESLEVTMETGSDDHHPIGLYTEDCNKVEKRELSHNGADSSWNDFKLTSENGRLCLDPTIVTENPQLRGKLEQLRETELGIESTIMEIHKREKEYSDLIADLERLPKAPSRKSYIQRITEISKSTWKQDADIERIARDTRELQKESNTIQERLHRTYAVVDETIFRDAKDDPVRRQAYRLLTSIHDSFEQISDTILAIDRVQRESAEHEAKLTAITSRTSDIKKLQADLEALRNENEFLEKQLHHNG